MAIDRRDPEQQRAVPGQEERGLEHGGHEQADDRDRAVGPRLSARRLASSTPMMPGRPGGHGAEHRDVGVREVVGVGEVAVGEL